MASPVIYNDHQQLMAALFTLLGASRQELNPRDTSVYHPISDALAAAGIGTWSQLVTIQELEIDDLVYDVRRHGVTPPAGTPYMQPLSIAYKGQTRALIAYYHFESRRLKHEALPHNMVPGDFDIFRTSLWDPNVVPTPWMKPLLANQSDDKELVEWQKITKPTHTDYPTLTDSSNVNRFIEQWESVSRVHRLENTLDKNYVPPKHAEALFMRQLYWMFFALNKQIKHPSARPFITKHITDVNAALVWDKIKIWIMSSMTNAIESSRKSTWMSSVRADDDWNGTQQDFIIKFQEERRSYNNLCQKGAQHTEGLSTQLLNTAVSGVPNLANVYTTH